MEQTDKDKIAQLEKTITEMQNKITQIERYLTCINIDFCYLCNDKKRFSCNKCDKKICIECDSYKKYNQYYNIIHCIDCYENIDE